MYAADLEFRSTPLDNKKQLQLKLCRGNSGQKFFQIELFKHQVFNNAFRNIPVPQDAYAFVRAFDELIGELASENFEQKWNIHDPSTMLKKIDLAGENHKFQLGLLFFPNSHRVFDKQTICLRLCSIHNITSRERYLTLPLEALPWLRKQMAEILTKHDDTEEIAKEPTAQIPEHILGKQPSTTTNATNNNSKNQKNHHSQQQSGAAIDPTVKRPRLDNYPIAGKGGNGGGEIALKEEQQSTTTMENNNSFIHLGGKDHHQQIPSKSSTAVVNLSSTNSNLDTSPGPSSQLLKNASRCNLPEVNAIPKTMLNGTIESSSNAASGSMVVSMELNGVLYQGALFAIPNDGSSNLDLDQANGLGQNSPNSSRTAARAQPFKM